MARGVAGIRAGEPSCPRHPPSVSAAEITELYDRCLASGLKACVIFNHAAGRQTLTVTCHLLSPAMTTGATGKPLQPSPHRRRSRAGVAVPDCPARVVPSTLATPTAPSPTQTQPPLPSPDIVSPRAKRMRKQQNELELLRDRRGNDELLVPSPLGWTSPPSLPCTPTWLDLAAIAPMHANPHHATTSVQPFARHTTYGTNQVFSD